MASQLFLVAELKEKEGNEIFLFFSFFFLLFFENLQLRDLEQGLPSFRLNPVKDLWFADLLFSLFF